MQLGTPTTGTMLYGRMSVAEVTSGVKPAHAAPVEKS